MPRSSLQKLTDSAGWKTRQISLFCPFTENTDDDDHPLSELSKETLRDKRIMLGKVPDSAFPYYASPPTMTLQVPPGNTFQPMVLRTPTHGPPHFHLSSYALFTILDITTKDPTPSGGLQAHTT